MRGPKPKNPVELTTEQEQSLRELVSARNSCQGKVLRALSWPKTFIRQAARGYDGLSCDCQ
jgi:hypothetical protein